MSGPLPIEPAAGVVSRPSGSGGRPMRAPSTAPRLMWERIGRSVVRAGWPGGIGAFLLVLAAALGYFFAQASDERRAELAAERARLLKGDSRGAPVVDDRERLKSFYDRFPAISELPARLRRLDELATGRALSLKRTDYRTAGASGTPLQVVTLSIPVQGDFAAIYGWLADVLADMPEVALESANVKRSDGDPSAVEVEARLQLYLRGAK